MKVSKYQNSTAMLQPALKFTKDFKWQQKNTYAFYPHIYIIQ
jgi:hypothetical protein